MGLSSRLLLMMIQRERKKKRRRQSSSGIPMDVVMEEILTRLPAKSLMRFKCVSKNLSSFISSRYFTNRFLKFPCVPRLYMCLQDLKNYRNSVTLSMALDNTATKSCFVVDHDLTIPRMGRHILQNLRGFMCYISWRKPRIYNPATRQLVTLPAVTKSKYIIPPPPGESCKIFTSYYFGHTPVKDQYKVVCSACLQLGPLREIRSELWVFVLKKAGGGRGRGGRGSWKKVAPTPADFHPHIPSKGGVCIDGVIYYLAWTRLYKVVLVSFNVRSQDFKMNQVPRRDGVENVFGRLGLMEYDGKVTIIDQSYLRDKGMLDLWAVEDAGNNKWSRKTLVLQPSQLHLVNNTTIFNIVKGTIPNGNKVFFIPEDLISPFHILCYDLQTNDMRKIEIKGIPDHWFSMDKSTVGFNFMDQSETLLNLDY